MRPRSSLVPSLLALLAAGALTLAAGALTGCAPERPERPNVLFIVVDTLRADHLPSYGYERDTAPRIHELLAERGAMVERAYSQAPWTLPSTGSLLTGRMPGELAGSDPEAFEIPASEPTLAERLSALGYRTAGFIANPILHEGNGFGRGFGDFYTPETTWEVLDWVDATTIEERALPWLEEALGPATRTGAAILSFGHRATRAAMRVRADSARERRKRSSYRERCATLVCNRSASLRCCLLQPTPTQPAPGSGSSSIRRSPLRY
jgi:arylsulfatase A-like enzyme